MINFLVFLSGKDDYFFFFYNTGLRGQADIDDFKQVYNIVRRCFVRNKLNKLRQIVNSNEFHYVRTLYIYIYIYVYYIHVLCIGKSHSN